MRGIFGSDSMLMKVLSKIFDIGYLSIVFIIFSLPVVTIGASLTALYYAVVKVIRRDRGYVFQEFFRSFKLNFVKATILWVIQAVLTFIMCFNLYAVVGEDGGTIDFMHGAYIVMGLLIFAVSCYAYPVLSRFDMKNTKIIRFSLYMAIKHVYFTIPIMVIVLASIVSLILLVPYMPIIPILVPGTAALVCSYMMERILKKYMPKDTNTSDHKDAATEWYNE